MIRLVDGRVYFVLSIDKAQNSMDQSLDKYFLGELSDTEKKELFDRIEANPEAKAEFIRMQNTITISQLGEQKGDNEWASRKMKELETRINRKYTRTFYRNVVKYAAVIALLLVNVWLLTDKLIPDEKVPLYTKIEVPKGQRIYITLQDGTQAWLSPRSVIKIPNEFSKEERSVELDGEGFFSVTKDAQRPFIVKTNHYDVTVLGTRFNVFAYSENGRFETNLVEGRVQVTNNKTPKESIIMEPGEMVSLLDGKLMKSMASFDNEEYLKSGIFYFSNKRFSEILDYLTLWYNVKFELKESAQIDQYVSGKFRQSDDVERVLKALQGVHDFKYKLVNDTVIEIF